MVAGASLGTLVMSGCPDIGYVYTDPDPTYPEPATSPTHEPTPTTTEIVGTTDWGTTELPPWPTFPETSNVTADLTSSSTTTPEPTSGATDTGTDTDPNTDTTAGTDTSGDLPVCGNGVVEDLEACDDGNQDAGDGCEADCTTTPVCGNGVVEAGEVCDDGNTDDGDECSADCGVVTMPPACGDGTVQGAEQCDDGNTLGGDGCEADCTLPVVCAAPADYVVCDAAIDPADKSDPLVIERALGMCNAQPGDSVLTADFTLGSAGDAAWQVARGFGSFKFDHDEDPATPDRLFFAPREGDTMLMLSTGTIAAPDADGVVVEASNSQVANGDNGNDDSDELPPPLSHALGSNSGAGGTPFLGCDGVGDCSDTLDAGWQALPDPNDAVWFTLHAAVPAGVFGYSFDMVFCSSEWPASLGKPENDLVIAWQQDPTPGGYTGNVATLPNPGNPSTARPLTLSTLHPHFLGPGFVFAEPQLQGTGFEQHACSSWLKVRGGVEPGSDVQLGFYLADRGDSERASVALLDNFRWDCAGCEPEAVDECGVTTAP